MRRIRLRVLGLVVAAIAVACGGGSGGTGSTGSGNADQTATLQWNAVDDPQVKGYRVYFGTASRTYGQTFGAGLDVGMTTTYIVTGLQSGLTYYFAVTSYGDIGKESDYSNEVSKQMK